MEMRLWESLVEIVGIVGALVGNGESQRGIAIPSVTICPSQGGRKTMLVGGSASEKRLLDWSEELGRKSPFGVFFPPVFV
ncbi:hypothetical protein ACLOJK_024687 [Asimina triloba]